MIERIKAVLVRRRERWADRRALRAERKGRPHDFYNESSKAQGESFRKSGYGGG